MSTSIISNSRWITIVLPGKYSPTHKQLYKQFIHPIIKKYNGKKPRCAYDTFTESEYKFETLEDAKNCVKELKKLFKTFIPVDSFPKKPIVSIMGLQYEKNGDRNIVRPDYHTDATYKPKYVKNFKL